MGVIIIMSDTGKRIKDRRQELNISADTLADALGVSRSTIFRYEKGDIEKVPAESINKIAKLLNTTPAYLMGWEDRSNNRSFDNIIPISIKRYPLLGDIACGAPIFCNEDRESYVEAGTNIHADFCLRAHGDSMINARIHDGDIVFIREQNSVDNGDIAAVVIGNEATLKRVYFYPDKNMFILKAENPSYEDKIFINSEISNIRILGKAVAFQSDVK
nr:S24 family peptidase [uncultured Lachnoclostridium sp.]